MEDLTHCDGSFDTIRQTRTCTIPLTTLTSPPWGLIKGVSVRATVSAYNVLGTSADSLLGNGAVIVLVPDPPINLQNVPAQTT
jgi:hypothetical protein